MTGDVYELYLSQLHSLRDTAQSNQQSLGQFSGTQDSTSEIEKYGTIIAVVTEPTGGIVEATDEYIEELGMPLKYLDELREERSNLDIEDSVRCHNQAVKNINLDSTYREYLQTSQSAQSAVSNLVNRICDGETITLVCFEKKPKYCHRRTLKEILENKVDEQCG